MKAFFRQLYTYNHYCNQNLYDLFNEHQNKTSEKSVKWFNHILNAQQIWNNRIEGKQTSFGTWDRHPLHDLKAMDESNYHETLHILGNLGLSGMIHYTNTNGQGFDNTVQDILFHVINHSTYHRGQIATECREHGLEPLVTDFIFYKR